MAGGNRAVFGIYPNRPAVEEAVANLRSAGFRSADVSVLFPENEGTKDLAHEKNSKAPEGATTGGLAGGIAGGVLGWLTGIGALAIPGVGPLIAAGPIVAALAGAGAVGTLGGIIGGMVGLGIPEYEAKRYEGRIREGGVLLSVHCDDSHWVKRAKDVLKTDRRTGYRFCDGKGWRFRQCRQADASRAYRRRRNRPRRRERVSSGTAFDRTQGRAGRRPRLTTQILRREQQRRAAGTDARDSRFLSASASARRRHSETRVTAPRRFGRPGKYSPFAIGPRPLDSVSSPGHTHSKGAYIPDNCSALTAFGGVPQTSQL